MFSKEKPMTRAQAMKLLVKGEKEVQDYNDGIREVFYNFSIKGYEEFLIFTALCPTGRFSTARALDELTMLSDDKEFWKGISIGLTKSQFSKLVSILAALGIDADQRAERILHEFERSETTEEQVTATETQELATEQVTQPTELKLYFQQERGTSHNQDVEELKQHVERWLSSPLTAEAGYRYVLIGVPSWAATIIRSLTANALQDIVIQ